MAANIFPPSQTTNLLVNTLTQSKIVYLPAASTVGAGKLLYINDICGNAATFPIFLSTTGRDSFDYRLRNSTVYASMSTNYQSVLLASDGILNWLILQNYTSNLLRLQATGGTIVTLRGVTYHVFRTSGTFTVTGGNGQANYLLVGGGGGGGDRQGGGGGGGGVLGGTFTPTVTSYTVTVGLGGLAGNYALTTPLPRGSGRKGGDSSITGIATAFGGGGGGTYDGNPTGTVGSGGGSTNSTVVAGTAGQGNPGGPGISPGGGGGGGAGAAGASTSLGGIGTAAYSAQLIAIGYGMTFATSPQNPISGGVAYIAAGGGGGANTSTAPTSRFGGLGGGGTGDWDNPLITAGTDGTGGGGGGTRSNTDSGITGRAGGTGLVVIWYR